MKDYIDSREIRKMMGGISRSTFYYYKNKSDFPKSAVKTGNVELWDRKEIEKYLAQKNAGKVKCRVLIDVANFQIRAWLTEAYIPTDEVERVVYFESGGKMPKLEHNIWNILPESEKRKVEKYVGMLGMSGVRGTVDVWVEKEKLDKLLQGS